MPTRKKLYLVFLCVLSLTIFAIPGLAAVPGQINFQGQLTDGDGIAVNNGTYTMQFRLFDAQTGGTQLWNAPDGEQQDVPVFIRSSSGKCMRLTLVFLMVVLHGWK